MIRCLSVEGLTVKGSSQQSWTSDPNVKGGCRLFSGLGPLIIGEMINNTRPGYVLFIDEDQNVYGNLTGQ